MNENGIDISPLASISPDARISASIRGSRIVIGAYTTVADFAVLRPVGGLGDIVIGDHCYINEHCVLYSGNGITIGDNVLIAPGVRIVPANHQVTDPGLPIRAQGFAPSRGGVVVEDDVWIGANCVLLDGARVGRGAVLAAGSVVNGVVPTREIWAGAPARKLKDRP